MNAPTPNPDAPAQALTLSPGKAWLVGGGLALVAALSLATALTLRGPEASPEARPDARSAPAEARETIVSTLSPAPARAPPAALAAPSRTAQGEEAPARPRSMAEAKRL